MFKYRISDEYYSEVKAEMVEFLNLEKSRG
jgi:hypothetical protein